MERQSLTWPELTVLVLTYKRPDAIRRTIESYREQSNYPLQNTRFLIADDCSGDGYTADLLNDPCLHGVRVTTSVTPANSGFGANANRALAQVQTPYVYFTEDDWVAEYRLDIKRAIAIMEIERTIAVMRMSGPSGTDVTLRSHETDISARLPNYMDGNGFILAGRASWFSIGSDSPTLYTYSNRPHIRRGDSLNTIGQFVEGKSIGYTEDSYAHMCKGKSSPLFNLHVACMPDYYMQRYQHIGHDSWQKSDVDKARGGW
jgi:glycosyltransferase involved in cell wall biosynthesis